MAARAALPPIPGRRAHQFRTLLFVMYEGTHRMTRINLTQPTLERACRASSRACLSLLFQIKSTPLHEAAICGHAGCLKALIRAGASINKTEIVRHQTE